MNLAIDAATIRELADGVVLLDERGHPRQANSAAQPWLRRCVELTPKWANLTANTSGEAGPLPLRVDIDEGHVETPPADVLLVRNGIKGYALLIHPRLTERPETALGRKSSFLTLLGGEVRQQLDRFTGLLRDFNHSPAQRNALLRQGAYLDTLLAEMGELAELVQRDEVFADDRLGVADLLRSILPTLPRTSGEDSIRYEFRVNSKELAPVYGNERWLRQALHSLLASLGNGCPPRGSVIIELRQLGDFVILSGRVAADAAGLYAVAASGAPAPPGDELRTEICRRIIALHGGQLKLSESRLDAETNDDSPGAGVRVIQSVTLTLPTGVPVADRSRVSCAECRITNQAMQFARDLADLMERGTAGDKPINH